MTVTPFSPWESGNLISRLLPVRAGGSREFSSTQSQSTEHMKPDYSSQLDVAGIAHATIHFSEVRDAEFCITIDRQSVINSNDKHGLLDLSFEDEAAVWRAIDTLNLRDDDEFCDTATLLINGEDVMNKGRWL